MTTTYEVRRGKAVIGPAHSDVGAAKTFAEANSHFPGHLKVWVIEHDEYPLPEATTDAEPATVTQLRPRKAR